MEKPTERKKQWQKRQSEAKNKFRKSVTWTRTDPPQDQHRERRNDYGLWTKEIQEGIVAPLPHFSFCLFIVFVSFGCWWLKLILSHIFKSHWRLCLCKPKVLSSIPLIRHLHKHKLKVSWFQMSYRHESAEFDFVCHQSTANYLHLSSLSSLCPPKDEKEVIKDKEPFLLCDFCWPCNQLALADCKDILDPWLWC